MSDLCRVGSCGRKVGAESALLCAQHHELIFGKPKIKRAHPAYKDKEPPSCYGDGGACPNQGVLYPGGLYCSEHSPRNRDRIERNG